VQLSLKGLSEQAQIFKPPVSLKKVFKDEIAKFDNRETQEKEAVKETEK